MMEASGGEQLESRHPKSCLLSAPRRVSWTMLLMGALLLGLIGTWLVWFSLSVQRKFNDDDIRAACQRVMPETIERCVDTVVIQRGGMRR